MPSTSSILAIRAVIAVFIRRSLGLALLGMTLVLFTIAILSAYNAMQGVWLLWIIFAISFSATLLAGCLAAAVYIITGRILPRKLTRLERSFIAGYARDLRERLVLARAPLPVFIFKLFVHVALREDSSRQHAHLENTIDGSKKLSSDFTRIRGFFE